MDVKRYKMQLFNVDAFKLEPNVVIALAEVIAGWGGGHGDRIVRVECECGALLAT